MEHTAQVMGIAGAGRGTGVTHFVIQAANYLCSCRQKKTAILQWNPQKDLEKIRAFLKADGKEDSYFYCNLYPICYSSICGEYN